MAKRVKGASIKIYFYDQLRMVATLSVLFIHLSGWFLIQRADPSVLYVFLANISRFAVPMFVFLAAALFYLKYSDKKIIKKGYYASRFRKILIPYLAVSVIYYVYRLSPLVSPKQKISFSGWENLFDFGKLFLTVGVFSHLYFVPLILMFYFVAPYLVDLIKRHRTAIMLALVSSNIVFVALMNYLNVERLYWRWTIFPYLIYVIFGFIFSDYYEKIKKTEKKNIFAGLVTVLVAIFFIYQPYNKGLFEFFGFSSYVYDSLFGLFWISLFLLFKFPEKINKIITFLSQKSFGIYLFHYLFIDLLFSLIGKGYFNLRLNVFTYPVLLVVVPVLSLIAYYPIEYLLNYKRK